jgi:cell division protein FtsA
MASRFIVGIDIGTSSVKVAVAENRDGKPVLRSVLKEPSAGVRKSAIVDLADASPVVARVLGEVKKISKAALKTVYVNIGTPQIKAQTSRGIVAVSRADSEIYQDDIDRVIKASQAVNVAPNRMIIHNITREYIVDGVGDIIDPLGLSGNRLEVNSLIVDAFTPHVKSIMRIVELAGARIGGMVFDPLVASRVALSRHQKDLGVVLVDIGGGTTSMSVYEEQKLLHVAIFPVGAGSITSDIAVGLRVPVQAAEILKVGYGYAIAREINPKESVELKKYVEGGSGTVSRRFIAEIIESRLAEIFEFVDNELRLIGKAGQLAGGVVLVGGGSKMPGLTELAKQELKLFSQIGLAVPDEWGSENGQFGEVFEDPEYVGALGLVLCGADQEAWRSEKSSSAFSLRSLIRYFMP